MYNNFSDNVNEYVLFTEAQMDPYADIQYAWSFITANRTADFKVTGKRDEATLETLESVFFTYKDPKFPELATTRSVLIPTTGRKLKFTYWLRPAMAPIVYIVPGLGSSRLADTAIALAEVVYNAGYSAVCVSSPFESEFMDNAATTALPAYLPVDGHDMHVALTEIDKRLTRLYPGRITRKALMGYSMGAFETLYIAAENANQKSPLLKFDRYLALNTPVRLLYSASKLDEFYRAPLAWPPAERAEKMENTFLKVAALSKLKLTPRTSLPFNAIESKFLIGINFRFILRDVIFYSQRRDNLGVLREPLSPLRRAPVYREIMRYSFEDYFRDFAAPFYRSEGMASATEAMKDAGDLRSYEAGLRGNPSVRAIVNENDFLLAPEDLDWLHATFAPKDLKVFPQGGHLGNLANPDVQATILGMLDMY